jgi:copper(I)-binding protein
MDRTLVTRRAIGAICMLAAVVASSGACAATGAGPTEPGGAVAGVGSASGSPSGLTVTDAWARPAPAGGESAAYLTIANAGAADTLVSVRCTIARSAMLHETSTDMSGMTGMTMTGSMDVPSGGSVRLAPGGSHVMLGDLTSALAPGTTIQIELLFEHAGSIVIPATIRAG